jgi:hypothetical protein
MKDINYYLVKQDDQSYAFYQLIKDNDNYYFVSPHKQYLEGYCLDDLKIKFKLFEKAMENCINYSDIKKLC